MERFRGGFELLGSSIGDEAFCTKFISKFTAKAVTHTLGPLSSLDDPQVVHMLIAVRFLLPRGSPAAPSAAQQAIAVFDAAVQKALAHGVGVLFPEAAAAPARGAGWRWHAARCRARFWSVSVVSAACGGGGRLACV
jgi:hypothetical protein